jgi:hypothetical protein
MDDPFLQASYMAAGGAKCNSARYARPSRPGSGEEDADSPAFEVYLNSPMDTAPEDLLTEICLPLKEQAAGGGRRSVFLRNLSL